MHRSILGDRFQCTLGADLKGDEMAMTSARELEFDNSGILCILDEEVGKATNPNDLCVEPLRSFNFKSMQSSK